jgi:DNA-binding NtrC family response regulator
MSKEVILFVDDEEKILKAVRRNLSQFFEVDTALGAEDALAKLSQKNDYAVIVSDLDMPVMNGIELLSRIQDKWPEKIRIMLTGKADLQSTIDAVNKDNVFRFLTKPIKTEDLKSAIDSGLANYRA